MKEIQVSHEKLSDPQTITEVNKRAFKEAGLDIHKNDVVELIDDHSKGKRIYKIKNTKFFDMGRRG